MLVDEMERMEGENEDWVSSTTSPSPTWLSSMMRLDEVFERHQFENARDETANFGAHGHHGHYTSFGQPSSSPPPLPAICSPTSGMEVNPNSLYRGRCSTTLTSLRRC